MENKRTELKELVSMVKDADHRAAMDNNHRLIANMSTLRNNPHNEPEWAIEEIADRTLLQHARVAMMLRMSAAKNQGKASWWKKELCSIETLRALLYKATLDDDLISVMNYAAMINARNITDKH